MNTSDRRFSFSLSSRVLSMTFAVIGGGLLVGAVAGCSTKNVVTFSQSDRKEGLRLYEQGRYTDAATHFRQQVRRNPGDYRAHYYLGACYSQTGQAQQAIHAYKSSLDTQTTSLQGKEDKAFRANTIDGLATAISKSDKSDVELDALEQKARDQQSAESYFALAKIYRFRGDADSAIDSYNRAMLLAPKDFYIAKDHGLYLEQAGQRQLAEPTLKKAYALKSTDADVNAALRRIGVVPGPGLLEERDLAGPPVPKGPIPPMSEWRAQKSGPKSAQPISSTPTPAITPAPAVEPAPAATPGPTVQTPRD